MLELNPEKKLAGVLAPVFALRGASDLGIGDTEALKEFISWCARQSLSVVQILPINETGSDNSPYNLLSAMAIEPSSIATIPETIPELTTRDFDAVCAKYDIAMLRHGPVRYREVKQLKRELLYRAFRSFRSQATPKARLAEFAEFDRANADWLRDYAIYRAIVSWHEDSEVSDSWPKEHRSPAAARIWLEGLAAGSKRQLRDLTRFHAYVQWIAHGQWAGVRRHADRENVALMGDVPVGVGIYSADVWREGKIFDTHRSSGAPPEIAFKSDPFTEQWGQNWGFPLYRWEEMEKDGFSWWRKRLRLLMKVFHCLRVDHALGFFRIYSFPWRPQDNARFTGLSRSQAAEITGGELPHFMDRDDDTEPNREYNRLRGEKLLRMFLEETGDYRLIAEDLGTVAPYVRPSLERLGIAGFKIPQWERESGRLTPGFRYQRNSLATYGTHDHAPMQTHWNELFATSQAAEHRLRHAAIHCMWELMDFCGRPDYPLPQPFSPEIHEILIRGLFACNSWLAINMIPDLFRTEERFNVPGSAGDANWTQRIPQPIGAWEAVYSAQLDMVRKSLIETGRSGKIEQS